MRFSYARIFVRSRTKKALSGVKIRSNRDQSFSEIVGAKLHEI
jgi:hypothetical protein